MRRTLSAKTLAWFIAGAIVGVGAVVPRCAQAWNFRAFQYPTNLVDDGTFHRYYITGIYVRYEDTAFVSNGSNVGIRGCSHNLATSSVDCAAWTYLPASNAGNYVSMMYMNTAGVTKINDTSKFSYWDFLRMGATSDSSMVKVKAIVAEWP